MCVSPRLANKFLRPGKQTAYRSATGGQVRTVGKQPMVFKTMTDHKLIQHEFEVPKDVYKPDVLII